MTQLESTVIRNWSTGLIEVELCSFTPTQSMTVYTNGKRAILGLSLPPYPHRRKACYTALGTDFFDVGNITLTPPDADCQFLGDNSRSYAFRCYFDPAVFKKVARAPDIWTQGMLMKTFDIGGREGARIDFLLRQMVRETEAPGLASETLIESLGLSALAYLSRHLHGDESEPDPIRRHLGPAKLRHLEQIVEGARGVAPTISDLAKECGVGPRRFTTLFKETTGKSAKDWIINLRIDMARKLLAETDTPIKAIAFDLGFANQSSFSTAFRRQTGTPPSAYRKRLRYAL